MSLSHSVRLGAASALVTLALSACQGDDNTLPLPADASAVDATADAHNAADAQHDSGVLDGGSDGSAQGADAQTADAEASDSGEQPGDGGGAEAGDAEAADASTDAGEAGPETDGATTADSADD